MKVIWLPGCEVWSMHKLNPRPAQPHRLTDGFGISLFRSNNFVLFWLFCFALCFVLCFVYFPFMAWPSSNLFMPGDSRTVGLGEERSSPRKAGQPSCGWSPPFRPVLSTEWLVRFTYSVLVLFRYAAIIPLLCWWDMEYLQPGNEQITHHFQ